MALALNSSHPLFGNILAFVCPNEANDTIVDLKDPSRVIGQVVGAFTFGDGTYGRSINAPDTNGSYLSLSPALLSGDRTSATYTVLVVANNTATLFGGGANQPQYFAYGSSSESMTIDKTGGFLSYSINPGANPTVISAADVLAAGSYSAAFTYSGANINNTVELFHNGLSVGTGTPNGSSATVSISALHSKQGFTRHTTEYAYIVVFDRVLTSTEISDLHNSLGADNQFALIESAAPVVTQISFTGAIPNQTFTAGDVVDVDLVTGRYTGTETPFTYASTGSLLAASGLSISTGGRLSGTATESAITGAVVTGTDSALNTAASNLFNITVNAAPSGSSATASFTMPQFTVAATAETTGGLATFTSEPLKNNTGALLASESLDYVAFYDNTTGALVLRVTGLSTDANGQFSVSDAALTAGVTYKVDWKVTSQLIGRMPAKAAV